MLRQEAQLLVRLPLNIQPDRCTEVTQQADTWLVRQLSEGEAPHPVVNQQHNRRTDLAIQACAEYDTLVCHAAAVAVGAFAAALAALVASAAATAGGGLEAQRKVLAVRAHQAHLSKAGCWQQCRIITIVD